MGSATPFQNSPERSGTPCFRPWPPPRSGAKGQKSSSGQMTYHLRRLRLHGLIERIPGTHRSRATREGSRTALFCPRTYNRILRPGLAQIIPEEALDDSELRRAFDQFDEKIEHWIEKEKVPQGFRGWLC